MKRKQPRIFSSLVISLIAMITMLIDHIGYMYGISIWLRAIGRVSFPLYAFLAIEGYFHTHDKRKHILKLFIIALISEIPFDMMIYWSPINLAEQNAVFTLLIGVINTSIIEYIIEHPDKKARNLLGITTIVIITYLMSKVDYGIKGITLTTVFGLIHCIENKRNTDYRLVYSISVLIFTIIKMQYSSMFLVIGGYRLSISIFTALSIFVIQLYNGQEGTKSKIFKYIKSSFYPVHITILCIIKYILGG